MQADAARKRGAREAVYIDGPNVLDPVYQMFQRGEADGAFAMAAYVPDDFYHSEFYQCFFRNPHLVDTIDVLWRIDERSSMAFCLGREEGTPAFGATELALVRHTLPLLFAMMRRHHQIALPPQRDETDRLLHRQVESTMANFGVSLPTKREREVVFYMLSGYSSEQTAARLHTADGTIRNQRKSIHRKLETGSQAELFSLFISASHSPNPARISTRWCATRARPGQKTADTRVATYPMTAMAAALVRASHSLHGEWHPRFRQRLCTALPRRARRMAAGHAGTAVVLILAINPWGFTHWQPGTENSVDLQRSFVAFPALPTPKLGKC